MSEIPGWGIRLQTEVENLQTALANHVRDSKETHKDLYQRTERPSWVVTWVLTIMGSAVGALVVWAATHA